MLSILIGEGGSGGALALAVANEVWMLENATYSILSPEGFASILWKDGKRADEAAEVMKITAGDLKNLCMVERVFAENIEREESEISLTDEETEAAAQLEEYKSDTEQENTEQERSSVLTRDNMQLLADELRAGILEFLRIYHGKTPTQIVEERYQRFRKF